MELPAAAEALPVGPVVFEEDDVVWLPDVDVEFDACEDPEWLADMVIAAEAVVAVVKGNVWLPMVMLRYSTGATAWFAAALVVGLVEWESAFFEEQPANPAVMNKAAARRATLTFTNRLGSWLAI
jgi:hypothetical protein